jgi:hypothetical protein
MRADVRFVILSRHAEPTPVSDDPIWLRAIDAEPAATVLRSTGRNVEMSD